MLKESQLLIHVEIQTLKSCSYPSAQTAFVHKRYLIDFIVHALMN